MNKWLLIYCKPRQDSVAVTNLQRQGFTAYSPKISVRAPESGVPPQGRVEPLFPSYVFISVDPEVQSIAPVRSTRGVLCFVRFGAHYASASEQIIERIRRSVAECSQRATLEDRFKQGDRIKINGGGFNDIDAVFSSSCGAERVMILLNVLGAEAKVSVPMEFISRVN